MLEYMHPTERIIVNILASGLSHGKPIDRSLVSELFSKPDSLELIRKHHLSPLIYTFIKHLENEFVDKSHYQALKQDYITSVVSSMMRYSQVGSVLGVLEKNGVDFIVLKGAYLAESIYADTALRSFSDIDIVLNDSQWQQFSSCLSWLGYSSRYLHLGELPPRLVKNDTLDHCLDFYNKNSINIDAKLDLLELGIGMKTIDDVWNSAIQVKIAGVPCKVLSPEYQAIHLLTHLNRHGYTKLIWFVDIALFIKTTKIGWQKVRDIATTEGVLPSIYYSLIYVNEVMGGDLMSDQSIQEFRPKPLPAMIWRMTWPAKDVMQFKGVHEANMVFKKRLLSSNMFINILLTGRPIPKVLYFLRRIWPPKEYLESKYADGEQGHTRSYLLLRRIVSFLSSVKLKRQGIS